METLHMYFCTKYGYRIPPEGWADDMRELRKRREVEEDIRRQTLTTDKIDKLMSLDHFVDDIDVILAFFYEKDLKEIAQQHINKCLSCRILVTDYPKKKCVNFG